jgi:signal transduction histidine kinase
MDAFLKRIRLNIKSFAELLEKWRWLILASIGLSLLWVEVQEFLVLRVLNQAFHYFEVFQYAVLLTSTGLLIELFARSTRAHKQAVKILEFKHRLSLELTNNDDWEALIQKLALLPAKLADVDETYLLTNDPRSGKFETAGHWVKEGQPSQKKPWDPTIACDRCLEKTPNNKSAFHMCRNDDDTSPYYVYSLEVSNQNIPTTVLRFRVRPDARLSRDDEQILNNIQDEITVAIQASQDRKRLSEMQSAEVAMAERRIVSGYVHDQLGQNLGYLHLKLDQLGTSEGVIKSKEARRDLKHLQEVANESYEIVRDILKKIQPETIPHLTNLLREHARTVSRRAGFTLDFKSMGTPIHLATSSQQLIFFTFREIISNVEKHANATKVDVLVIWNDGLLDISVADNGKGFDPSSVRGDEHFGLEIMRERISNINGRLMINSSTDSGTVVSISIPVESTIRASI